MALHVLRDACLDLSAGGGHRWAVGRRAVGGTCGAAEPTWPRRVHLTSGVHLDHSRDLANTYCALGSTLCHSTKKSNNISMKALFSPVYRYRN